MDNGSGSTHRRLNGGSPLRHLSRLSPSVQAAMRLRRSPMSSGPTARAAGADPDFQLAQWLQALRFLGDDHAWRRPGIAAIWGERALDRASLVVGMVMLCTPNGRGDLLLDLKDPSGIIGASVHKKVLSDENLGGRCGISVGSVIVLQQVAVLRPSHTACYLNVTKKNVLKVLHKVSSPCTEVVSSHNTQIQQPAVRADTTMSSHLDLGDKFDQRAGAQEITSILSKMCRTRDSQIVEVLSGNSDARTPSVHSTTLGLDKDANVYGGENHHEIRLEETWDLSPPRQNVPNYSTSQPLPKSFSSMNPANSQVKQVREADSSADSIMRRLLGGETVIPTTKKITVAEASHHSRGTPQSSCSTSTMHADARSSSEKQQEIGLQNSVEGLCSNNMSNCNSDEFQLQNSSTANTRCSQPILSGNSVMSGKRDCTQAFWTKNPTELSDGERMLPGSKRLKSDAVLSDGTNTRTNNNNTGILSMDAETKYGLENNLNIGLADISLEFCGEHPLIRTVEHQQKDFNAADAGTVQPTQENFSSSVATTTAAVGGTLLSNPKMSVSVAPIAEWTDKQLSELFADY